MIPQRVSKEKIFHCDSIQRITCPACGAVIIQCPKYESLAERLNEHLDHCERHKKRMKIEGEAK